MIRGEIYWASLRPRSGSEQSGRRPVLIISNDGFNSVPEWRSIIVVPLSTSQNQARRGPTVVVLPKRVAGLEENSVVLCHQITTLDRIKITERIGMLPKDIMKDIETALLAALGIRT